MDRPTTADGNQNTSVAPALLATATGRELMIPRTDPLNGGTGRNPVWGIHRKLLGPSLNLVPDSPRHGVVEPAFSMTLDQYRKALADTQPLWLKVAPGN